MSDDASDKPYEPSEHKLQEARKRGEVPQVKDLPTVLGTLATCLLLWLTGVQFWRAGEGLVTTLVHLAFVDAPFTASAASAVRVTLHLLAVHCTALVMAGGVVAVLARFLLVGPVFSAKPVTPDFSRLNPLPGLKRMWSRDTWVGLVKQLAGALLVLLLSHLWLRSALNRFLAPLDHEAVLQLAVTASLSLVAMCALVLAVIGVFDFGYQLWSYRARMRMDMKDLRDEYKQQEGSPEVKSERRQEHQRLVNR